MRVTRRPKWPKYLVGELDVNILSSRRRSKLLWTIRQKAIDAMERSILILGNIENVTDDPERQFEKILYEERRFERIMGALQRAHLKTMAYIHGGHERWARAQKYMGLLAVAEIDFDLRKLEDEKYFSEKHLELLKKTEQMEPEIAEYILKEMGIKK